MLKDVKIAYIGGGSRGWARTFMGDLAVQSDFCGSVKLYDIDREAAETNVIVAEKFNEDPAAISKFKYSVASTLKEALTDVQFVVISILPGTFDEMESDVHTPLKYGIYHSVGDTAGPGGVVRAMRTVPMYQQIAKAIEAYCPNAWVISFTNPMTWCVGSLYATFPKIKALGCCHEVFGTQGFLAKKVVKEMLGEDVEREEIKTDVMGVNHFTWFTKATFRGQDLFPLYKEYCERHAKKYYPFVAEDAENALQGDYDNAWNSMNLVKMDLFMRYGQIAAAGDRHLVEFLNKNWYLRDAKTVAKYGFGLTPVSWRKKELAERLEKTYNIVHGKEKPEVKKSGEEFTYTMRALLGIGGEFLTNMNMPNVGQLPFAPLGAIVESNAVVSLDSIKPVSGEPLCTCVENLEKGVINRQQAVLKAIIDRNINDVFLELTADPLCAGLNIGETEQMFAEMLANTKKYLGEWKLDL